MSCLISEVLHYQYLLIALEKFPGFWKSQYTCFYWFSPEFWLFWDLEIFKRASRQAHTKGQDQKRALPTKGTSTRGLQPSPDLLTLQCSPVCFPATCAGNKMGEEPGSSSRDNPPLQGVEGFLNWHMVSTFWEYHPHPPLSMGTPPPLADFLFIFTDTLPFFKIFELNLINSWKIKKWK